MTPKILTYDTEIAKAICGKNDTQEVGIEYVTPLSSNPGSAWANFADMGISVLVAHASWTNNVSVIMSDNVHLFRDLIFQADFVAGFNNWKFDDRLIAEVWDIEIPEAKKLDYLVEIWAAHGLSPAFYYKTHGGFSLNDIIRVNYGVKKLADGANAPKLWQRGQFGELISYCINDVQETVKIGRDLARASLLSPKEPGKLCGLSNAGLISFIQDDPE